MLLGDEMLDVKRQEIIVIFVKPTVFTASSCPFPDEGP
jgi:hypothetical protein